MKVEKIAVLDANVLYPFYLREFLMRLSKQAGLFRAKWTNEINEEWTRNLRKKFPDFTRDVAEKTVGWMNNVIPDACVDISVLLPDIKSLALPDKNDAHVVAAALASQANYIVTENVNDFPYSVLSNFNFEIIHPDEFIQNLFNENPEQVLGVLIRMAQDYDKPKMTVMEIVDALARAKIPRAASLIRSVLKG